MDELKKIQTSIRSKLNELRHMRRELLCLKEFIIYKRLDDEYYKYRIDYYKKKNYKKEGT